MNSTTKLKKETENMLVAAINFASEEINSSDLLFINFGSDIPNELADNVKILIEVDFPNWVNTTLKDEFPDITSIKYLFSKDTTKTSSCRDGKLNKDYEAMVEKNVKKKTHSSLN